MLKFNVLMLYSKIGAHFFHSNFLLKVITRHIKNVFEEGELQPEATVAFFATVVKRGIRGEVEANGLSL